jgi:hypothetical protein
MTLCKVGRSASSTSNNKRTLSLFVERGGHSWWPMKLTVQRRTMVNVRDEQNIVTNDLIEAAHKKKLTAAQKRVAWAEKRAEALKLDLEAADKAIEMAEKRVAEAKENVAAAEQKYKEAPDGFRKEMAEMSLKSEEQSLVFFKRYLEDSYRNRKSVEDYRNAYLRAAGSVLEGAWNTAMNAQKLDEILGAVQNATRPTPQYSAANIGNREIMRLKADDRFIDFEGEIGEPSVLTAEQAKELSTMENEHRLVAYITPFLEETVKDTASGYVFNSEQHKWIKTSKESCAYNERPDLIIIHPAFITSKLPFNCKKDQTLKRMQRISDKFGALADWKLRDFIGLTCEAKQIIDNEAFGEVVNYGAHICFDADGHGAVVARLLLFDKNEFWLVDSVNGVVASVVKSGWLVPGSKRILHDFVRQPALAKLLNKACNHFNVTVGSDSFLGAGAFGHVFRAQRGDGASVALKIALNLKKNVQRLGIEASRTLRAKQACPDEVVGLEEDGFATFDENGAALLLSDVGEHFLKFSSSQSQSIVDSLQRLHESGIVHGDARPENVVWVNGKPRWIDFADSDILLDMPQLMKKEMDELKDRLDELKDRFKGNGATRGDSAV